LKSFTFLLHGNEMKLLHEHIKYSRIVNNKYSIQNSLIYKGNEKLTNGELTQKLLLFSDQYFVLRLIPSFFLIIEIENSQINLSCIESL
jgi:hypothetical protein